MRKIGANIVKTPISWLCNEYRWMPWYMDGLGLLGFGCSQVLRCTGERPNTVFFENPPRYMEIPWRVFHVFILHPRWKIRTTIFQTHIFSCVKLPAESTGKYIPSAFSGSSIPSHPSHSDLVQSSQKISSVSQHIMVSPFYLFTSLPVLI